uniref:uncharacterized protein LOC122601973 n=1 Tax=Erigeron canadensis TaxID=72917 RepID=UPI001CB8C85F|nr:uncharacterized protein LOC122601973 [Erigeron canadensis]
MANPTRRTPGLRSQSPTGRFASSTTSAFTQTTSFFQNHRSASPTRINLYGSSSSTTTYSLLSLYNRQMPRGGSNQTVKKPLQAPKRMCMCSPTSHPGSFRCGLHKSKNNNNQNINSYSANTTSYPSNRLNARRSAMTNSLVRIGTVEGGDLVKRALAALIRPSSHQQRRRTSFQPTRSRLSVMTTY